MFQFKNPIKSMIISLLLTIPLISFAGNQYGCAKKEANLERQLGYAKQYGNQHRINNLNIALERVRTFCGQKGSYDDVYDHEYYSDKNYELNLEKKINKHREKVREAEYALEKAKIKGKTKKIAQKEEKLKERQAELNSYLKAQQEIKADLIK